MNQADYFNELRRATSNSRLQRYFAHSPETDSLQAFGNYLWNIALCESLYPGLQGVEISLRNSIHEAASTEFGDGFWFRNRLMGREQAAIANLDTLFSSSVNHMDPGLYISECSFGFWVGLFKGDYEQVLWTRLLPSVFPHAPRRFRSRSGLHARLNQIRRLRNRVFHHEPVWHLADLEEQHRVILETIGWMSPAMLEMTRLLDRFPSVYTRGSQPYVTELDSVAQNWRASTTRPGG